MGWSLATASCCCRAAATPSPPRQQRAAVPRHLLFDCATPKSKESFDKTSSRRSLLLMLFPFAVPLPVFSSAGEAAAAAASLADPPPASEEEHLERYTDGTAGFTLVRPSSWLQVEKAGATALFEEEGKGSNNIGVVVNPVRLSSLEEFGTPQFVADKLIQAERRKESTKDAVVILAAERLGRTGLPVYEFEYTVDSTRGGMKRIFSAAFVASRKLYLLNVAHSDRPENPLDSQTRTVLEQVLHSFDTAS